MSLNTVPVASQLRQREAELVAEIKACRLDHGLLALVELLQDRLEKTNQRFLTCTSDEFLALQARAAVYAQLIKEISA